MNKKKLIFCSIFLAILTSMNLSILKYSQAQEDLTPILDKLNSLEKDIRDVQRKVNSSNLDTNLPAETATVQKITTTPKEIAEHEIRIIELEDQLRRTNGLLEELSFKLDSLNKQTQDLKLEINKKILSLEKSSEILKNRTTLALSKENILNENVSNIDMAKDAIKSNFEDNNTTNSTVEVLAKINPEGDDQIIKSTLEKDNTIKDQLNSNIAKPKELYQRAYSLLSKAEYAAAETAFKSFIKKFPKDPLSSNAYYWLGETFYVRQNYQLAAYNFANGYKNFPEGSKAADQLLKLGISLYSLKKNAEACATFTKLNKEFTELPVRIAKRAKTFSKKLEC